MNKKFNVEGMTCAACQAHVQKAVANIDGVKSVNVNLLQNNMVVEYDSPCSIDSIEQAVSKAGYKAYLKNEEKVESLQKGKDNSLKILIFCIVDLLVLMYISMGNMMFSFPLPNFLDHHQNPMGFALIQFIMVLPILYSYRKYFISGYKKLFNKSPNMDTLIAIGATASIIYGIFALFMISYGQSQIVILNKLENIDQSQIKKYEDIIMTYHDSLYFESAGMILTLVSLGKYFEELSKRKTTTAITKLMDLKPKLATILVNDKEEIVSIENVKVGDILIVRKGEAIPVDGVIVDGSASINQSNITGESIPVYKQINEEVFSSTLITAGYIKIKATKVGEDTSLSNIIKLVEEASNSKAPISKLADRVSGVFVPIILCISILSFVLHLIFKTPFERALNFAITVVVIACPCALGLATPVAIMVGTGKGAENGLLIKNAEILENSHLIKTVVLDKTGTITNGKPQVTDFENYSDSDCLLNAIYSLENKSEHPLALSIVEYAMQNKAKLLEVEDYYTKEGLGLYGKVNNDFYAIGNAKLLKEFNIENIDIFNKIDILSKEGKTPLVIIKNNKVEGIIAVKDSVKENTKEAILKLKAAGIRVIMLTGDNKITANHIAKEVGIDEVISDVLPKDKQDIINSLKVDNKHLVAMVGDGVNDAPALTSADLGIAIGGGSDVALESSDIVLLRNNLLDVLNVINLSKRVLNAIKLGLFWAFFYNCVCVFFATGILYKVLPNFVINPMIGSLAMSISSVSVVLNALTINFFKVDKSKINVENIKMEDTKMKTLEIKVDGMMCMHCVAHVEKACKEINNVVDAKASLDTQSVVVSYENEIDENAIRKSIIDAGYTVK